MPKKTKVIGFDFVILQTEFIKMKQYIKKICLFTVFICCHFASFAQSLEFMGVPLNSNITEYIRVLTEHGFADKYQNGDLAHKYWESGCFWTQKGCYVDLYYNENKNVERVRVLIPYKNFDNADSYSKSISDLISDLTSKYGNGQFSNFNMEDIKSGDYFVLYDWDHNGDKFSCVKWNLSNGELVAMYNNNRVWTIKLLYTSIERINKIKKAREFKGKGKSDL